MRFRDQQLLIVNILFYALLGAVCYFLLRYVCSWLLPFLLGFGFCVLMRPTTLKIVRVWHWKESHAAIFTLVLFYLGLAGVLILFLTIVLAQAYELLLRLPELYAQNVSPLIERIGDWFYAISARFVPDGGSGLEEFSSAVSETISSAAVDGSSHLVSWAAGLFAKLPILFLAAIFTIMISLLAATNYRCVVQFLCKLIPRSILPQISGLQTFVRETVWQMVRAYTIIMAITFVQLVVGLWLLGFEYVLPVAAAITLVDLLPLIGSGTVLVPWGIVLIAGGDLFGGIGLLFLFGIILVVRNIVEPRIVGKQIGLHPIATITAMYAGLKIAGFWGLFLAPILVLLVQYLWQAFQETDTKTDRTQSPRSV